MIRVRMRVNFSVAKRGRYRHVFAQTRTPIYTDQQDPYRGDAGVFPWAERFGFGVAIIQDRAQTVLDAR